MSNFTKENLYELYERHIVNLKELSKVASGFGISLEIVVDKDGTITFDSKDWFTTKEGKRALQIYEIVKGDERTEESSKTFVYDNK
jgi:hypothetical protein